MNSGWGDISYSSICMSTPSPPVILSTRAHFATTWYKCKVAVVHLPLGMCAIRYTLYQALQAKHIPEKELPRRCFIVRINTEALGGRGPCCNRAVPSTFILSFLRPPVDASMHGWRTGHGAMRVREAHSCRFACWSITHCHPDYIAGTGSIKTVLANH
jgi:hypothetical protein